VTGATAATDTIQGTGTTYNLTALDAGNDGTVFWTNFGNIHDTTTGTITALNEAYTLNGANTGTAVGVLFSNIGNITDTGTGKLNMHGTGDGSLSGTANMGVGGLIDYTGYTTAVTFD